MLANYNLTVISILGWYPWGRVSTDLLCVCRVEMNGYLYGNILTWIIGPCPWYNLRLVIFQHIVFHHNLWLLFILPPALPWGKRHVLFQHTSRQNFLPLGWKLWGGCYVSIVLGWFLLYGIHTVTGVGRGNHVELWLIFVVHICPWSLFQRCTHCETSTSGYS